MAEEKREIPQAIKDQFLETYKHVTELFHKVMPTQAEQEQTRGGLQKAANSNYEAFKSLADLAADDGNNVPLMMAAVESRNLAQEAFGRVMAGVIAAKDPALIIGELGSFLLTATTGPLNMTLWEKYQAEQIEVAASDKV